MATYLYPTARELMAIGAEFVAQETLNDPLLSRVFPITTSNSALLQWSVDADDYGLQQLRGIDGSPVHVQRLGKTNYVSEPGYFGEFETLGERELTMRSGSMTGEGNVDVADLIVTAYTQMRKREITRIRQIGWTLLGTGTFSISGKGSTQIFTDTFTLQTSSGSAWGTAASGTPLLDLRTVQGLGSQYGVNFGSNSIAVMNRVTANKMLANTNAADLGGRRTTGGGTVSSVGEVNRFTLAEDLPEIVVYDAGYKNDSNVFTKFIADNKTIVMGTRTAGDRIGEYRMTRNLVSGGTGHYEFIKDYIRGVNAPKEVPPKIEVHAGHNGGPVIFRPNAIVVLTTT